MNTTIQQLEWWLHRLGWVVLGVGLLLQFTIRDRVDYLSAIFYALPRPLLGGLALVLACWPGMRRIHRIIVGVTGLWILSLSFHGCISSRSALNRGNQFRALFWNLNRPNTPRSELFEMIKRLQPDVVGCVEPGPNFMDQGRAYESAVPGYTCQLMPRGLVFLSRWPARMPMRHGVRRCPPGLP